MSERGWGEKVADQISAAVRGYVAREFERAAETLWKALGENEKALAALADKIAAFAAAQDGQKLDAEAVASMVLARMPAPERGKDGADGKDGASVTAEDVRPMLAEMVAALPKPLDGRDGRDAADIEPMSRITLDRSYKRGTYAMHDGGMVRALRDTDPNGATLAEQGWAVTMNGIAAFAIAQQDDLRTFKVSAVLTDGREIVSEFKLPVVLYRGVFDPSARYERGDQVTYDGSTWIAMTDTTDRPGTSDAWRLSSKRGRDAREQKESPKSAATGVVRIK